MATTIASFSAIDDTAIDAESPIVESMMKQIRDNSYWIDAGTRKTTETSATKVLTPNGSGGVAWVEVGTISGVDGTKGSGTFGTSSGAPTVLAVQPDKKLMILFQWGPVSSAGVSGSLILDESDDTYIGSSSNQTTSTTGSGTLTGSFANLVSTVNTAGYILGRVNGTNYEFYENYTGGTTFSYIWL